MKIVYTDDSISDLERLRGFIAKHNPSAATRISIRLVSKIAMLADFPEIGRLVQDATRDIVFDKYIVRYLVDLDTVTILRIWHGLEDKPR